MSSKHCPHFSRHVGVGTVTRAGRVYSLLQQAQDWVRRRLIPVAEWDGHRYLIRRPHRLEDLDFKTSNLLDYVRARVVHERHSQSVDTLMRLGHHVTFDWRQNFLTPRQPHPKTVVPANTYRKATFSGSNEIAQSGPSGQRIQVSIGNGTRDRRAYV